MLRVSCTTLESYRLWRDGDWMDEAELLATIRGEFRPTPAVLAGQAFGRLLECPVRYAVTGGYHVPVRNADGETQWYRVDEAVAQPALALMDYEHGVFELKGSKVYGDCTVVGKVDQIVGDHVFEHKTTAYFDVDKYASSYQWRYYLDLFGGSRCTYHVFLLDDHGNGVLELKGIESFTLYPYRELRADCEALVREFRDYVRLRGLEDVLRARQVQAA